MLFGPHTVSRVSPGAVALAGVLAACGACLLAAEGPCVPPGPNGKLPDDVIFLIGLPDQHAAEFGLAGAGEGYAAYLRCFPSPVVYTVGSSDARAWPYIHPAPLDRWAGGRVHPFTIRFQSAEASTRSLYLVLGLAGGSPSERSRVVVSVGGTDLPAQTAPSGDPRACFDPTGPGKPETMIFEIPPGRVVRGENTVGIRLEDQSWILYDYVALRGKPEPLPLKPLPHLNLLEQFQSGPMAGVEEIIFAARQSGEDPHWYANFGTTLDASSWRTYLPGGRLCRLHLASGKVRTLLDDPDGNVRDPAVHPDGRKVVFSYREGKSPHYHLHEIDADGSGLRQLTSGPYDDVEPSWLPDGGIIFVSTRCKRRVNCHTTEVAVLYRCEADGGGLRPLSSNIEHDNTPWVLPSGQVLYTRWEYVDRDQMAFHHLWTTTPDGARQTVFFGNLHPGITMIDAKPIPGSPRVVASFSPGHGIRDHDGVITLVDPRCGPDDVDRAKPISRSHDFRDPWAFSEDAFLAARGTQVILMDGAGRVQVVHELGPEDVRAGLQCHEPRPLVPRPTEPLVPSGTDWSQETGRVLLVDVTFGRNMAGVKRGEIKKLLVLETLPKPMNYTGGMEPLSYGGTFTLERILGTVPVEPDGSAYAELPALRSLFFVALDGNELSVKRMQSFFTLMPGETTTCLGCHEGRTSAPPSRPGRPLALGRAPSKIEPIPEVPDVIDYPRDIQPIFNRHCMPCHDDDRRDGGLSLSGDRGPLFSISYYSLTARALVSDGRNGLGNRPPRSIGSSASHILEHLRGSSKRPGPSEHEKRLFRLWIDSGAAYPGTYAALGTGMVGGFEIADRSIRLDRSDTEWPSTKAAMEALQRRCGSCHKEGKSLPLSVSHVTGPGGWGSAFTGVPPWVALTPDDVRRRYSRHLFYNLTRPEKSLLILAPLAKAAGGFEACGSAVFADTSDLDYLKVLRAIQDAKARLEEVKRFDMPGFRPRREYLEEMKRHGILPADLPWDAPVDVYATDQAYWRSLWYAPGRATAPD